MSRAVRISSHKTGSRNGRERHDFSGQLHSDKFGVVFSGSAMILNCIDEKRRWTVMLNDESTAFLEQRFTEWRETRAKEGWRKP